MLRLREIRLNRSLTQKEVAESIGCTVGAYSKYETGDRDPSITTLKRLADFYGVSVDYLIGRDMVEMESLTVYEKDLVNESRKASDFARKSTLEILELLNKNGEKNKRSQ